MAIQMLDLHVERLADIVLAKPEALDGSTPLTLNPPVRPHCPCIELENVGFRYGEGEAWVLRHIDLTIGSGEHVAIVGRTGCGKPTLAKIILGLLQPRQRM